MKISSSITGIAIGLSLSQAVATQAQMISYGTGQCLSPEQVTAALYLSFPQSYAAIWNRFGPPEYRDRSTDWHCLPNGGGYLKLNFNRSGKAIGISWSRFNG